MIDSHIHLDEAIRAVRVRMQLGHTKEQIAQGLAPFIPQDLIFLAYHAALLLGKNPFTSTDR